jgi:ribA/ribD-fused uncharacterized protein
MKYTKQDIINRQNQGEKVDFLFFWGHQVPKDGSIAKSCFSQWYISPFVDEQGIVYHTAEHYMMAGKARLFQDELTLAEILASKDPKTVKTMGRKITPFDAAIWESHHYEIVKKGNFLKFSQNEGMKSFLLSTDNQAIVEASPFDAIWDIGLDEHNEKSKLAATWRGENLLGFALMEVRDELKK